MKLERQYVEKPWGVTSLPPVFGPAPAGQRIGEVRFTGAGDQPVLAKYLFTGDRLSIQVHPDNDQARMRGFKRGKRECWYILDAVPDATLGLGLTEALSEGALRAAAQDGSIEQLLAWRPVRAGDFFLVPAGTIHTIGSGISLLEFQQGSDITYRLYDYGRDRMLHLEDALAVASREPYANTMAQHLADGDERTLVNGPDFVLIHTAKDALVDRRRWVMPLAGQVRCGDDLASAGDCLLVDPGQPLELNAARMLIGATA